MSHSLPPGWVTASLADLCDEKVMQGPPTDEPVPYIDIGSIDRPTKRVGETILVTLNDAPTRARQWVRTGDVVVSMTRPNLNAVAQVGADLDGAVASTGFDVLRPRTVDPTWIFHRVCTNEFVADVCEDLQGVVYPAIRPHDVRRHKLPLPPLLEQHRIVEAIESYLTRLDDAVATLERVQRNLKRYRASVLKAAVEGRLVPTEAALARDGGPSYEPASVLLERILAEHRRRWEEAELAKMKANGKVPKDDRWKAKYVEPAAPDTNALPELPEGWCWASVNQVSSLVTDGDHNPPKRSPMGIPHLTARNVKRWMLTLEGCSYLSEEDFEKSRARYEPIDGDLIVTCVGTVGECAIVPRGLVFSADRNLAAIRFAHRGVLNKFGLYFLSSPRVQVVLRAVSGSTAQPHLYLGDLRSLPVAIPPRDEQERIVDEIERLLSEEHAASRLMVASILRCSRLRQSILKWAFEGRLVDQDPSDEPASLLLERIRTERGAATADEPKRRRPKASRRRRNSGASGGVGQPT